MNRVRDILTEIRAMPQVFRASIVLLIVAIAAGQLTQHQAAGPNSALLLIAAARACPKAAAVAAHQSLTVVDTERTVDRALRWMIMDRIEPQTSPRCGGSHRSANT